MKIISFIKYFIFNSIILFSIIILKKNKLIITTGASSNHFKSLLQLIDSIYFFETSVFDIIVYDLGLNKCELSLLKEKYPQIILKNFDYSKYPPFFNIKINAGAYAWKPAIIYSEYSMANDNDYLIWIDAGCKLIKSLNFIRFVIYYNNLYSTFSGESIKNFTHYNTLKNLSDDKINNLKMLNATLIGLKIGTNKNKILIQSWYTSSCNELIISPLGSNISNHRYDQSLFSIFFYKIYNLNRMSLFLFKKFEVEFHKDID
jgi:hypothetical protein